jgi:hypothetical protein
MVYYTRYQYRRRVATMLNFRLNYKLYTRPWRTGPMEHTKAKCRLLKKIHIFFASPDPDLCPKVLRRSRSTKELTYLYCQNRQMKKCCCSRDLLTQKLLLSPTSSKRLVLEIFLPISWRTYFDEKIGKSPAQAVF